MRNIFFVLLCLGLLGAVGAVAVKSGRDAKKCRDRAQAQSISYNREAEIREGVLVDVDESEMPVMQLLEKLRASGLNFVTSDNGVLKEARVTVKVKQVTALQAARAALTAAGIGHEISEGNILVVK